MVSTLRLYYLLEVVWTEARVILMAGEDAQYPRTLLAQLPMKKSGHSAEMLVGSGVHDPYLMAKVLDGDPRLRPCSALTTRKSAPPMVSLGCT